VILTTYGYDAAGQQRGETIVDGTTPVTMQLDPEGRVTAIGESYGGGSGTHLMGQSAPPRASRGVAPQARSTRWRNKSCLARPNICLLSIYI